MKLRNPLLGLAAAAALAAAPAALSAQTPYAHLEGGRAEAPEGKAPATTVEVRNQNYLDVNVYAWSGAQRVRLGTVTGLTTASLRVPDSLLFGITSLQFEVDPIGSRLRPYTDEVSVTRGDEVILTVPPFGV